MKKLSVALLAVALVAGFSLTSANAEKKSKAVTVTGTSSCSKCVGVGPEHAIMLETKGGIRFVLLGDSQSYKDAYRIRSQGKKMIAILAGPITEETGKDGKPFLQAVISKIEVKS